MKRAYGINVAFDGMSMRGGRFLLISSAFSRIYLWAPQRVTSPRRRPHETDNKGDREQQQEARKAAGGLQATGLALAWRGS